MRGEVVLLAVLAFLFYDGVSVVAKENEYQGEFLVGGIDTPKRNEKVNGDNVDQGLRRRKKRSTAFTSDEIQGILDKHNVLRGQVSPEASNMEFMVSHRKSQIL